MTYNGIERDGQTRTQGGYSNKIVVDENYVLRIPDNLPMDRAAPLLCAGITMYSPLIHWKAGPGKKVGVVGLGGLGHMGVKIAHALDTEVSVISHSKRKQDEAKKMGADKFYATSTSSSTDQKSFDELKGYFNLILNTLSVEIDWNHYLNLLALDGTMVVVGLPEKESSLGTSPLINARRSLAGSGIGGLKETQEMLDFCSKYDISSDIELIPIQEVNEAYPRIVNSDVRYRFVVDMKSLD
jgi:uncharacterized zinc-type alcohol dehydrogenase-like protein